MAGWETFLTDPTEKEIDGVVGLWGPVIVGASLALVAFSVAMLGIARLLACPNA